MGSSYPTLSAKITPRLGWPTLANINADELKGYRKAAKIYLGFSDEEITAVVKAKALIEIAPSGKRVERGKSVQERSVRGATRKHV